MENNQYNIGWNTFQFYLQETRKKLYESRSYADVTLVSDDLVQFRAHRIVVSAASDKLRQLLEINSSTNQILYLKGVQHQELESILQFIYLGQAKVFENRINIFAEVSKDLDITELNKEADNSIVEEPPAHKTKTPTIDESIIASDEELLLNESMDITSSLDVEVDGRTEPTKQKRQYRKRKTISSMSTSLVAALDCGKDFNNKTCPDCDKTFSSKDTAKYHYLSMHQGVRVSCTQCDKSFANPGNLHTHIKSKHEGVTHKCDHCDKIYSNPGNLYTHIKSIHEGVTHKCDHCDKTFSQKGNLRTHIKKDHENGNFVCKKCEEPFSSSYALWKHNKQLHQNE